MSTLFCRIAACVFLVSFVSPCWSGQTLLYTPQPAPPSQKVSSPAGILVQEIEVQKGDSLYSLSRKFSGRGMYYPQILLFNSLKNPHLIHPGELLKIPVGHRPTADLNTNEIPVKLTPAPHKKVLDKVPPHVPSTKSSAAPAASPAGFDLTVSDLKAAGGGTSSPRQPKRRGTNSSSSVQAATPQKQEAARVTTHAVPSPPPRSNTTITEAEQGQKLFEAAVKAYRRDDCRSALELLDRYLASNSASPLAADATLYKAECYLKLSAQ